MQPSILTNDQSKAFNSVRWCNAAPQSRANTPCTTQRWKFACAVEPGKIPVASNARH